jgi:cytochrome-b5 reductase
MEGPDLAFDESQRVFTYKGRTIRKISLLAGGTGLAPMVQFTRAYFRELQALAVSGAGSWDPEQNGLRLLYAAEEVSDLAYSAPLDQVSSIPGCKPYFSKHTVLNKPPVGWEQGLGFVTPALMKEHLWFPPADDHFVLICGPPIFEKIMCGNLKSLGFERDWYYSFAEG